MFSSHQSLRRTVQTEREVAFRMEDGKRTSSSSNVVRDVAGDVTSKKRESSKSVSRKSSFKSQIEKMKAKEEAKLAKLLKERDEMRKQFELERLETERTRAMLSMEIQRRKAELQKKEMERKQRKLACKSLDIARPSLSKVLVARKSYLFRPTYIPIMSINLKSSPKVIVEPLHHAIVQPSLVLRGPAFVVKEAPLVVKEPLCVAKLSSRSIA